MRATLAAVTLLLTSVLYGQEYWSTVPAPTQAPICVSSISPTAISNYTWKHPFTKPTPGGVYHVSNAIFDKDGRIGAWSQPTICTVKNGWILQGGAWNQPIYEDGCGIAWRLKVVSINQADDFEYNDYKPGTEHYYTTSWNGSYHENEFAPYSAQAPYVQLLQGVGLYSLNKFPTGGTHTAVAQPPPVEMSQLPNCACQIALTRVAENGDTAMSPPYTYEPPVYPEGTTKAETIRLDFTLREFHPQGTLGFHVYYRKQTQPATQTEPAKYGRWYRVPAPQCLGEPKTSPGIDPDEWLFPWWMRQFSVVRLAGNVGHKPPAVAQSRLSWIHRMLRGDPVKDGEITGQPNRTFVGDVICPAGSIFNVTCPVIDEYGNNDQGTTGGPGDQKHRRRIRSETFGEWRIVAMPSLQGHTSWPTVGINNQYSRWIGATITSNGGDAVATSDYFGGCCFGNQLHECSLSAAPITGRVTCGLRVDSRSSSWAGNHTASEWLVKDCTINGSIAVWMDGNQTANMRFDRLHANSYSYDARGSVVYLGCPSPFKFINGLYCDAYQYGNPDAITANNLRGRIFFTAGGSVSKQTEGIWVDTGFGRFLESDRTNVQLRLSGGKLNVRGRKPSLATMVGTIGQPPSWAPPNSPDEKATWLIEDLVLQLDPEQVINGVTVPATEWPRVISNTWRQFNPLIERTPLAKNLILQEPGEEVALQRLRWFAGPTAQLHPRDVPGYKVPSAGGVLTVNSLTTGQPVQRDSGVAIIAP